VATRITRSGLLSVTPPGGRELAICPRVTVDVNAAPRRLDLADPQYRRSDRDDTLSDPRSAAVRAACDKMDADPRGTDAAARHIAVQATSTTQAAGPPLLSALRRPFNAEFPTSRNDVRRDQRPTADSNSQGSNSSGEYYADGASTTTPPAGHSGSNGIDQDSQLLRLSQLAAALGKMPDSDAVHGSRKRMADGVVKHTRGVSAVSGVSPTRSGGHSRTTSAVSMASTTGSRIGEVRRVGQYYMR
jgi:hypothetical protein